MKQTNKIEALEYLQGPTPQRSAAPLTTPVPQLPLGPNLPGLYWLECDVCGRWYESTSGLGFVLKCSELCMWVAFDVDTARANEDAF